MKEPLSVFILLDRSGSMSNRWGEAIGSLNAYVQALTDNNTSANVTVSLFDDTSFDTIRNEQATENWNPIREDEAQPRGMTPLFDAIGKIVTAAEDANAEKTVLVIITDGAENCSKELNKAQAQAAIQRCKDRNWQAVFLGADFDAFGEAGGIGIGAGQTLTMTKGNYGNALNMVAESTALYSTRGVAMSFSDEDRERVSYSTESI